MDSPTSAAAAANPVLGLSRLAMALQHTRRRSNPDIEAGAAASDGAPPTAACEKKPLHDGHPFFHYYGLLIHQQNMLQE